MIKLIIFQPFKLLEELVIYNTFHFLLGILNLNGCLMLPILNVLISEHGWHFLLGFWNVSRGIESLSTLLYVRGTLKQL